MGRELRRVPEWWEHPTCCGRHVPLFPSERYPTALRRWLTLKRAWDSGDMTELDDWEAGSLAEFKAEGHALEDWNGKRPNPCDHMPQWEPEECTHYQMYENTSEGTPISPVLDSPHAVARWCADNNASAFGNFTASYDGWCHVCGVEPEGNERSE